MKVNWRKQCDAAYLNLFFDSAGSHFSGFKILDSLTPQQKSIDCKHTQCTMAQKLYLSCAKQLVVGLMFEMMTDFEAGS